MRERIYRVAVVLCYIVVLAYMNGFSLASMLDARAIIAVLLGMVLFSLPQIREYWEKRCDAVHFCNRIAYNGMMSGCLTAILFLLAHLSAPVGDMINSGQTGISRLIGADLRPVLYGLCIYTALHVRGPKQTQESIDPAEQEKTPTNDELYLHYQKLGLTNRETELAILAFRGYSNREIAEECYISEATVKKHMTHIFEKLGIERREELQNRGAGVKSGSTVSTDETPDKSR